LRKNNGTPTKIPAIPADEKPQFSIRRLHTSLRLT
jgi:hypothetical protein